MAFCLGPFCGFFRDELGGDSESDEEDDGSNMRAKNKKKVKRRKPKKGGGGSSGSTNIMWASYLSRVRLTVGARAGEAESVQEVTQLKAYDKQGSVSESMLNRINQLQQVYVIDIMKCGLERIPPSLDELENLMSLILSNNSIRKFNAELRDCSMLATISLDWNQIGEIPAGLFTYTTFKALEVITLSHNRLAFLPNDFGQTARESLKYVDLSYNTLASIPDKLVQCRNLQELNLAHNKIQQLPECYDLKKLKKLHLSFNVLHKLPENIGKSTDLAKLRITSNQIKKLPFSILTLWKKNQGKLEEFLVTRNPLQMPSITAFEMEGGTSGMDRAFHLLEEYGQELEKERKRIADASVTQLALAEEPTKVTQVTKETDGSLAALESQVFSEGLHGAWYFGHCEGDQAKIMKIRSAEQSFLVKKRHIYLEARRTETEEVRRHQGRVPEDRQAFLDPNSFQNYKGAIPLQDIDLFFALFVFATKPHYHSAATWFDKFEVGDKGYMSKREFYELCLNSSLDVRQKSMDDLWAHVFYPSSCPSGLTLVDFIAACHIHDMEERDPWIVRLTEALRLEYFDMTISEMEARLRAANNLDATPQLSFHRTVKDHEPDLLDDTSRTKMIAESGTVLNALKDPAGLTAANVSSLHGRDSPPAGSPRDVGATPRLTPRTHAQNEVQRILTKVSLSELEHRKLLHVHGEGEESSAEESEASIESGQLSHDELSEVSEFDAQAFIVQHADEVTKSSTASDGGGPQLVSINGDGALHQLMQVSVKDFFKGREAERRKHEGGSPLLRPIIAKPGRSNAHNRDRGDDVLVRQSIRECYRSMPFFDFVSLISFLLRGLHRIQEDSLNTSKSHWHHVDEPAFKYAMGVHGQNNYTSQLLHAMGFVRMNHLYWVWPCVHLRHAEDRTIWGDVFVPPNCPGLSPTQLEDMITLLTSCLVVLNTQGKAFTGHFSIQQDASAVAHV